MWQRNDVICDNRNLRQSVDHLISDAANHAEKANSEQGRGSVPMKKPTSLFHFLPCCLVSLLTGCGQLQPLWHLAATKEGDTVQLCLSNESKCPQPEGVSPAGISVYRYDSTYDNELVWDAEPEEPITNGRISGVVTYGIPPKNWTNKIVPPALICGKAYLVNPGAEFFALKCDGSVVVFDFQHLEEFFRQQNPPAPTKKRPGN